MSVLDKYSVFERMWFAVLEDGTLVNLGDHGDYEAAYATATDLGYNIIELMCMGDKQHTEEER